MYSIYAVYHYDSSLKYVFALSRASRANAHTVTHITLDLFYRYVLVILRMHITMPILSIHNVTTFIYQAPEYNIFSRF